jgi:hypothetical protein
LLIQEAAFEGALQNVRQKQTDPLKLRVDGVGRLASGVNSYCFQ